MTDYQRKEQLDRQLGTMQLALRQIANGDCEWPDEPAEQGPCMCNVCVAKRALKTDENWRFRGAHATRLDTGHNPRENAIVGAWQRYMQSGVGQPHADCKLQQLIDSPPTERDWYVASSIVQWLATNVGQCILSEAGYQYTPPKS